MVTFVVDDNFELAEVLSDFLVEYGYDVATFNNGRDAIERLEIQFPDLIITDIEMPDMDGLTLRSHILRLHPHCKFILMTGGGYQEDGVLRKPFRLQELLARATQLCEKGL